jgi:hypothetical protein
MKRINVQVGDRKKLRQLWAGDIKKLYYVIKRTTPRLPKYVDD